MVCLKTNKLTFCKLIFVMLFLLPILRVEAMHSSFDVEQIETLYVNSFVQKKVFRLFQDKSEKSICDLPKEKKLAICDAVLRRNAYKTNLKINLNKAAAFYGTPTCVEKMLTFRSNTLKDFKKVATQKMFPCYGRHKPMRTNWNADDYYDIFHISAGPTNDSLFVYIRIKTAFGNVYSIYEHIEYIKVQRLPPINAMQKDARSELKSLKTMSFNLDVEEIETNYIREMKPRTDNANSICDFGKEKKLQLCKKILNRGSFVNNFLVNNKAMMVRSIECEEKEIFLKRIEKINDSYLHQWMFPCYGLYQSRTENDSEAFLSLSVFYLGEGFRDNSIMVYVDDKDQKKYSIYEFVENVFLGLNTATMYTVDDPKLRMLLFTETIRNQVSHDPVCSLPNENKLALCEAFFEQAGYTSKLNIYFNKTASFHLSSNCVKKKFTLMDYEIEVNMFPCYGRHNPMRTNWNTDDYFDTLYLSSGPERDSLFVWMRGNLISEIHWPIMYSLIIDVGIYNLPSRIVSKNEVDVELQSLNIISVNRDDSEVETIYVREKIKKNLPIYPVCDLEVEKKLTLCKVVFDASYHDENLWILNTEETVVQSTECEEKRVEFKIVTAYNDPGIRIKMFPCRGKISPPPFEKKMYENKLRENYDSRQSDTETSDREEVNSVLFHLSAGSRPNSAIVYAKSSNMPDAVAFSMMIENLNMADLPAFGISSKDTSENNNIRSTAI